MENLKQKIGITRTVFVLLTDVLIFEIVVIMVFYIRPNKRLLTSFQ